MTFPVSEIMDRLRQARDGWLRSTQERRFFPEFEVPDQPGAALTGLPDGLHVDVFFFDPVARAGLYAEWQAGDGHTERTEEAATDFLQRFLPVGSTTRQTTLDPESMS
jgi:hypothetical protein